VVADVLRREGDFNRPYLGDIGIDFVDSFEDRYASVNKRLKGGAGLTCLSEARGGFADQAVEGEARSGSPSNVNDYKEISGRAIRGQLLYIGR
jgi:hypothetical protein